MPAGHSARLKAAELRERAVQAHAQALRHEDDATHWDAGAEGEERVAAALELAADPSTRVLHDRLLHPGTASKTNIDHLFVSERGIFLIDAKNWTGDVVGDEGSLRQRTSGADGRKGWSRARELGKVRDAAVDIQRAIRFRVTPVLCLAGEKAADFGVPQEIDGVHVVPIDALQSWLGARPALRRAIDVGKVAVDLSCRYPEATGDAAAILPPAPVAAPRPMVRSPAPEPAAIRAPRRPGRGAIRLGAKAAVGLVAIVLLITVGPHVIDSMTHAAANTLTAAGQTATTSPSSTMSPAKLRRLDNWSIRAGLYENHDEPSSLPYEPDSGLGTQSAACRTQKATLAPLRRALLAAPDKTLAADAAHYDHAVRDLLHACIHDHPVALHHARSRMDAAASTVNVRYNRLLGVDPSSYEAKQVL